MKINPAFMIDGYKADHRRQYPKGTNLIYSNMTARSSRIPEIDHTVFFGLQYFVIEYLIEQWNENFFKQPKNKILADYKRRMDYYLNDNSIGTKHIGDLHDLGYLPLRIKAVPEGTKVKIGSPSLTIRNTHDNFFWLTNYIETILSNVLWKPCTSATIANHYREVFEKFAKETGADSRLIPYQGHDFSFRGLSAFEDACLNGAAHLLSFYGTDTIPAIDFVEQYYGSEQLIGCSVPATEHSVMCMGEEDGEFETFERLIFEIYPKGIVSIVSDTWDFWKVINDYLPRLKDRIIERNRKNPGSKVVIRPDSGDPVKIICGDPNAETYWEQRGAIAMLCEIFGGTQNEKHYRKLDPAIGLIYGDSITMGRQKEILGQLKANGYSSDNIVLGIGSFTYQYQTRDTFGFAMKATYGEVYREGRPIFKNPKTGGWKKSHRGLLTLNSDGTLTEQTTWKTENEGMLEVVFEDGKLIRCHTFDEIRNTLAKQRTYQ